MLPPPVNFLAGKPVNGMQIKVVIGENHRESELAKGGLLFKKI
jgi:hypothetical protein